MLTRFDLIKIILSQPNKRLAFKSSYFITDTTMLY